MQTTTLIDTGPTLSALERRLAECTPRFLRERMPVSDAALYEAEKRQRWQQRTGYTISQCRMIRTAFRRRDPAMMPTTVRAYYLTLSEAEICDELGAASATTENPTALHDAVIRWQIEGREILDTLSEKPRDANASLASSGSGQCG